MFLSRSVQKLQPFEYRQNYEQIFGSGQFPLIFPNFQFWKNKFSKIFEQKNFEIFWGSFLENLLMGSSDDPTQKTIHCVHLPMADPKIPNFGMIHDIAN